MADIRNCKRCGRIFNYLGGQQLCYDCRNEDEKIFRKVKEYLYEHPGATISQVSMDLDVSMERIKAYLREGRLEIIDEGGNMVLECESCGKSIRTGRFCDECSRELARQLKESVRNLQSNIPGDVRRGVGLRYVKTSADTDKKYDRKDGK